MKRKLISLLLCAAMFVTVLGGCASGNYTTSEAEPQQSTTEETPESTETEQSEQTETAEATVKTATTEDVTAALADENSIVLDARVSDAYNGWQIDGAARGGHIKGAQSFSALWLTCDYDEENNLEGETREQVLTGYLEDKNLTPDKNVIVYDTNGSDAAAVADYLISQGITNVSTYDANEWINDESLEMESYPNYDLLLPAGLVQEIVSGNVPEGFTDAQKIVVVDVRWGSNEESGYLDGHIPTSVHVNTDSFEPPMVYVDGIEEWRLADDATLLQLLLDNGITADTCVIATGPEPLASSRFATICQYMGVQDVRVMNGGLTTWAAAGYELETEPNDPQPATEFGVDTPANPDVIDTIDEVKEMLTQDNFTLVDNRTWEEYIGESTGYSYHDIAGRIEGAVFGYAGRNDSSSMCYYRNIDKTMRSADEILAMWEECGIDTSNHLSFMCGSGWRAAEVYWDARVMGLTDVSLYSDGWIAWSNEGNPYITGDPTQN